MSPKRRTDTFHVGERMENKARSEAKKPILNKHSKADVLLKTIEPVTDEQRHRARIAVASRAHGPDDCAGLLDALGLREVG